MKFTEEDIYRSEDNMGDCFRCKKRRILDPHHRVRRKNDKSGKYVVGLCRECHDIVHRDVETSYSEGFLISYYDTEEYGEDYKKRNT